MANWVNDSSAVVAAFWEDCKAFGANVAALIDEGKGKIAYIYTYVSTTFSNLGKIFGNVIDAVRKAFSGQEVTFADFFEGVVDAGTAASNAAAQASGEAARKAKLEWQASEDAIVSNSEKNSFLLAQHAESVAQETAASANTAAASVGKAAGAATKSVQKETEKQKTLVEQLKEALDGISDSWQTRADVAELEFQVWENAMGSTATASEALEQKLSSLNSQLSSQEQVVSAAKDAYDQIVAAYGAASDEAQQFRQTLLEEVSAYQELQQAINETYEEAYQTNAQRHQTSANIAKLEYEVWKTPMRAPRPRPRSCPNSWNP